jgi:translation elongation factor EF-1alpha
VEAQIADCLRGVGFAADRLAFVPVSGLEGHNLLARHEAAGWCDPERRAP